MPYLKLMQWLLALLTFCVSSCISELCGQLRKLQWVAVKELFIEVTADWHIAALASEVVQVPSTSVLISEYFILTTMQVRRD